MKKERRVGNNERACELNKLACDQIADVILESARENFLEAIRIAPQLAQPSTNLGVLFCCEDAFDEAIDLHLNARFLDPKLSFPHVVPAVWCEIVD